MTEEVKMVKHVLTEADFAKSPALADNGFAVAQEVTLPETSLIEGVVTLTIEDFARANEAKAKAEAEAAAGVAAAQNGTSAQGELSAAEQALADQEAIDKEASAAKVKAEADAADKSAEEVEEAASKKSAVAQAATAAKEDPLDFIVHPRKRRLAEIVIASTEANSVKEDVLKTLEEEGFGETQAREMHATLVENGVLDGEIGCNC